MLSFKSSSGLWYAEFPKLLDYLMEDFAYILWNILLKIVAYRLKPKFLSFPFIHSLLQTHNRLSRIYITSYTILFQHRCLFPTTWNILTPFLSSLKILRTFKPHFRYSLAAFSDPLDEMWVIPFLVLPYYFPYISIIHVSTFYLIVELAL